MSATAQLFGAVVVLFAYLMAQVGLMRTESVTYLLLNLLGGAALAAVGVQEGMWGFAVVDGVWALIAAAGLPNALARRTAVGHGSRPPPGECADVP